MNHNFNNSYQAVSSDRPRWEKTPDGFLRCRARILAERIMPYGRDEMENLPENYTNDEIHMFVGREAMSSSESLRSLEGVQCVTGDHNWLDPGNAKDFAVGHVAGTPSIDGPYVVCDLLITDPQAIEDIESEKYPEISAAYSADTIFDEGEHEGEKFNARQTKLRYNHIAIIPAGHGRAGQDVRIINKKGECDMAGETKVMRVRLRNTGRTVNMDEEAAAAVESEMEELSNAVDTAKDENEASGKKLEEVMNELETSKGEAAELQSKIEGLEGELSVYKEKLDELLSGDSITNAAEEMIAEQGEAEEIVENMTEEGEKREEVMNSLKGLRGEALHSAVLSGVGVDTTGMSRESLKGAFKAQSQICNTLKGKKTVAGVKVANAAVKEPVQRTSRQRLGFS